MVVLLSSIGMDSTILVVRGVEESQRVGLSSIVSRSTRQLLELMSTALQMEPMILHGMKIDVVMNTAICCNEKADLQWVGLFAFYGNF